MQAKSHQRRSDQALSIDTNLVSVQAVLLREISGLKVKHLAEIFGVSQTTYHRWMNGSPISDSHKQRLLEALPLLEKALQRLGNPDAVNTWLFTPVSPGGKKPIEYLSAQQYTIFHGFLLRAPTGKEMFRPLQPSNLIHKERSPEEVRDVLERLRPRIWIEDMALSDTDDEDVRS